MPRLKSANDALTYLASDVNPYDNVLQVLDASAFPDAPFRILVGKSRLEIMEVSEIDRENNLFLGVLRGLEGTEPMFHEAGSFVENAFTSGVYNELVSQDEADQMRQSCQEKIDGHRNEKANRDEGVHGLRIRNGKLEYWDENEVAWKEMDTEDLKLYSRKTSLKFSIIFG